MKYTSLYCSVTDKSQAQFVYFAQNFKRVMSEWTQQVVHLPNALFLTNRVISPVVVSFFSTSLELNTCSQISNVTRGEESSALMPCPPSNGGLSRFITKASWQPECWTLLAPFWRTIACLVHFMLCVSTSTHTHIWMRTEIVLGWRMPGDHHLPDASLMEEGKWHGAVFQSFGHRVLQKQC